MCAQFLNLTPENLADEHLCCIIRSKKAHPGVEAKRQWLAQRLPEGHVFRKLDEKATVFIEYAPLETAWVPILGDNYLYIYCLWVTGESKGRGYGRELMEYCLDDAREKGKSGVCMLGAAKQKAWLSDQAFARKFGFETVDTTENGYELLALSFDGTLPHFSPTARAMRIESKTLTIYTGEQCPFVAQYRELIDRHCREKGIPVSFIPVDTLEKAKSLPCVFNNFAVFYGGFKFLLTWAAACADFSGDVEHGKHDNHHKRRVESKSTALSVHIFFLLLVFVKLHYSDVWKIPIFLCVIQTVAYDELVRDIKAGIIYFDIAHSALRLVEQSTQVYGFRISLFQDVDQIVKRSSGIDDILHDQNVFSFQRLIQVFYNTDNSAGLGVIAVT